MTMAVRTNKKFRDACAVHASGGPFSTFASETRPLWSAIAQQLCRRWALPSGCTSEDVLQELLLAAWRTFPRHDPDRGELAPFVVWGAISAAKRWMHQQRGVSVTGRARPDRQPSFRFLQLSPRKRQNSADRIWLLPEPQDEGQTPDECAEARERAEGILARQAYEGDRIIMSALLRARGSVVAAAELIYGDPDRRRRLRLGSEQEARRLARRALRVLAAEAAQ